MNFFVCFFWTSLSESSVCVFFFFYYWLLGMVDDVCFLRRAFIMTLFLVFEVFCVDSAGASLFV